MKNRFYILALAVGLAPGLALAQATPNYGYPGQQNDQDHRMQRQDRDQQQRMDQDYDRGSRQEAGNIDRILQQRFPNTNIQANYQDNNTVVLTGTAATGHDRKDAVDFVRSQLGGARVVDQIQVTGYGRGGYPNGAYQGYPSGAYQNGYPNGERDRDNGYNGYNRPRTDRDQDNYGQSNDRGQQVDRDQNSRVPQSDVDANRTDRDRNYAKDKDNHHEKDKKHKKDKDKNKKDHDRRQDQDQQPH